MFAIQLEWEGEVMQFNQTNNNAGSVNTTIIADKVTVTRIGKRRSQCPLCGDVGLEQTTLGRIPATDPDDGYDHYNSARCWKCGWSGKLAEAEKAAEPKGMAETSANASAAGNQVDEDRDDARMIDSLQNKATIPNAMGEMSWIDKAIGRCVSCVHAAKTTAMLLHRRKIW